METPLRVGATDARRELEIQGRVQELSIQPGGRIWMTSALEEIFAADSVNGDWARLRTPLEDEDALFSANYLARISFFDRDTALITGNISLRDSPQSNLVLRTTDGGATWDTVPIPGDMEVYTALVTSRGEAWLGGSSGQLLYSSDFGRTWTRRTAPFDRSARLRVIDMASPTEGIVGALANALKRTADNGGHWESLPTPLDQHRYTPPKEEFPDNHIQSVAYLGPYDIVTQNDHVFYSRRNAISWAPIPGAPLVDFAVDRQTGTAYGLGEDGHVVRFDERLAPVRVTSRPLHAGALHLTAANGILYVLDSEGGLYRIDAARTVYSRPLTSTGPVPSMSQVRLREGELWGATAYHLYTSSDGGTTWARAASLPFAIHGFEVMGRDSVVVWDGHGMNAVFDRGTGMLALLSAWRGDDVVRVTRLDTLWVAYGGRQHETAERVEVAQTFYGGQFRGSRDSGFVYVSRDAGRSWESVDRWPGSGVANVFVDPAGITLYSYLGSVRRLARDGTSWRATDLLAARSAPRERIPYVQWAGALYFDEGGRGFVEGQIHHVGPVRYRTADGGRSWVREAISGPTLEGMVPVRGGWAASTGNHVVVLTPGGERREVFDASRWKERYRPAVTGLSTDEKGNAVILVRGREVFVYDPASEQVRPLARPNNGTGEER